MNHKIPIIVALEFFCGLVGFAREINAQSTSSVEVYVYGQQPTSAATEQTRRQKDLELRPSIPLAMCCASRPA